MCVECWSRYKRQNRLDNLSADKVAANKQKCAAYHSKHREKQNSAFKRSYAAKYAVTQGVNSAEILAAFWAENREATKKCSQCGRDLSIRNHFYVRVKLGRVSIREHCKKCHTTLTLQTRSSKPAGSIWSRYKRTAKLRGFEFNIVKADVEEAIKKPCSYCGEDSILMTLDRVDNTIGYTSSNVVPCCIRCNIMKADMPKDAWFELIPHIRKIREAGLFGNWVGRMGFAAKHRTTSQLGPRAVYTSTEEEQYG